MLDTGELLSSHAISKLNHGRNCNFALHREGE